MSSLIDQVHALDAEAERLRGIQEFHAASTPLSTARELVQQECGKRHPFFATRLEKIAENLIDLREYQKAIVLLEEALNIRRETLGKGHPACASSLVNIAIALFRDGRGSLAEPCLREALQIRKDTLGLQHPAVHEIQRDLRVLLDANEQAAIVPEALTKYDEARGAERSGDIGRAEALFKEAIELNSVQRGLSHPHTASCKSALADLYLQTARPAEALSLLTEVAWARSATKTEHPDDYASAIVNLGRANAQLGFYAEAEKQLAQGVALMEEAGGGGQLLAGALNALSTLNIEKSRTLEAMPLLKRAAEILEEQDAEGNEQLATVYANLAWGSVILGRYVEAEKHYHRALSLKLECFGEHHPSYARTLGNYGVFCTTVGRTEEAARCLHRALTLLEQTYGPDNVEQAHILDALSGIASQNGGVSEAIQHSRRAVAILAKSYGSGHPRALFQLLRLARLLCTARDYKAAEAALAKASELLKTTKHPTLARRCLRIEGHVAVSKGDYENALILLDRAISMPLGDSSDSSSEDAFSLEEFVRVAILLKKPNMAAARLDEFEAALSPVVRDLVGSLGEGGEELVASLPGALMDSAFTILSVEGTDDQPMALRCLRYSLRYRGCALDMLAARQRLSVSKSEVNEYFEAARDGRKKLHELVLAGPLPGRSDEYIKAASEIKQQIWDSEQHLNAWLMESLSGAFFKSLTEAELAGAMPPDSSLVEFVKFRSVANNFDPQYLAFLFEPLSGSLRWTKLGPTTELEKWLAVWRDEISVPPPSRIDGLLERAEQHLVKLLVAPIFGQVSTSEIWIVPDGELWSVPFEALPGDGGARLCDRFRINYLSTSRDLIVSNTGPPSDAPPVIFADPDFDLSDDSDSKSRSNAQAEAELSEGANLMAGIFLSRPKEQFWEESGLRPCERLPGARLEAERIGEIIGAKPIIGADALDPRFRAVCRPSILHVATHGLFWDSPERWHEVVAKRDMYGAFVSLGAGMEKAMLAVEQSAASLRAALNETPDGTGLTDANVSAHFDNPMLCSGLLFAGVNSWLCNGDWATRAEDGIVTAQDVLGMDLLGTQMVVLSSCETGRGTVQNWEGVFGLRRAFQVAGVRTLVMSLWRVSDEVSHILMTRFYQELQGGGTRSDSMRKAREHVRLTYPDPYFWAPFICQGDQSSLLGIKPQENTSTWEKLNV
jgi:CHAT domain-containing protein/tetratricopeptide (TPR) repeat protein